MNATTTSKELRDAFRFHRQNTRRPAQFAESHGHAAYALSKARFDVAHNVRRYPAPVKPYAAVCWQPGKPSVGFVQSLDGAGLREVGRVVADCGGRNGLWDSRGDSGWFTDPHGESFKDGTGLCWGVVYQLPARDGATRFVAGYVMGGCSDDLPAVDFGTIYESEADCSDATDCDAAQDAARAADSMAQQAAELEREYQTAWQAGSQWADLGEQVADMRRDLLAMLAERRKAKAAGADYPTLCAALAGKVADMLEEMRDARDKRDRLASGDGAELYFWPGDKRLAAAFNDGAGADVLPA